MAITWWRHQMETSSALLAIWEGNSPVTVEFPHKGQWRGALRFSLICACINCWVNSGDAGDLRRHCAHYDFTVMNRCTDGKVFLHFLKDSFICPWTKWPPFRRRHFQMHFREWKSLYFASKFLLKGPVNNKSELVEVRAWRRTGDTPLPQPMPTQFTYA